MVDREGPSKACLIKVFYVPLFLHAQENICLSNIGSCLSSYKLHSLPLSSRTPIPFSVVQDDIYTSFCQIAFKISCFCAFPVHMKLNLYFLLLICVISVWSLVQLEGLWRAEEIILPQHRLVIPWGWGEMGMGNDCSIDIAFPLGKIEMFWNLIVMIAQFYEWIKTHWMIYFKVVKTVHIMLCVFDGNKKKYFKWGLYGRTT